MLKLTNVEVCWGRVAAVHRVSLHVDPGEIVALIGANGAGKTTLLSAISGLVRPARGQVIFSGQDISRTPAEKIVRLGLGHVPERRLVFSPLSVADNLALGAYCRRSRRERPEVEHDLEVVYNMFPVLRQRREQLAGTLSGGEQQMLAIGRALMSKPRMLLLDEPGLGLAPTICRDIFERIARLRAEQGLTVLVVEQNVKMALAAADRGYVLENGRVLLYGSAQELLANRDVQRAYLGRSKSGQLA